MTEQPSPDKDLAERVAQQLAIDFALSETESAKIGELILAGKRQEQLWFEFVEQLVDREEGPRDGNY